MVAPRTPNHPTLSHKCQVLQPMPDEVMDSSHAGLEKQTDASIRIASVNLVGLLYIRGEANRNMDGHLSCMFSRGKLW